MLRQMWFLRLALSVLTSIFTTADNSRPLLRTVKSVTTIGYMVGLSSPPMAASHRSSDFLTPGKACKLVAWYEFQHYLRTISSLTALLLSQVVGISKLVLIILGVADQFALFKHHGIAVITTPRRLVSAHLCTAAV